MERHALIAARILISIIFLLNGLNIIGQTLAMHDGRARCSREPYSCTYYGGRVLCN